MIAAPQMALEAAAAVAARAGIRRAHPRRRDRRRGARCRQGHGGSRAGRSPRAAQPFAPPCVLLSGGETTVTVRATGRGGRCVAEFLLSLAIALDGRCGDPRAASPPTPTGSRGREGDRRRRRRAGHAGARVGARHAAERTGLRRSTTSCRLSFRAVGDFARHRADAHQRQRLPRCDPGQDPRRPAPERLRAGAARRPPGDSDAERVRDLREKIQTETAMSALPESVRSAAANDADPTETRASGSNSAFAAGPSPPKAATAPTSCSNS